MISVYIKTDKFVEPDEPLYYLVAGNGVFLVKKAGLFTAVVGAQNVAGLENQSPALRLMIPRVPRNVMEQVYGFFDVVYRQWDGEAVAFLYYSPERAEFHVDVPPQTLFRHRTSRGWRTEGRLEYGELPRPDGFLWIGDVHSHGDVAAFFSEVDDRDDGQDGLRIVMGRLDRSVPALRVSFVTGGTRFDLPSEQVLEDYSVPLPPPSDWLQRVRFRCEGMRWSNPSRWNESREN